MDENNKTETEVKTAGLQTVERISNLPGISSALNFTSSIYGSVKGSNSAVKYILESAESSVNKAKQLAEPVTNQLGKPIKKADAVFCNTIDYVGASVPKVVEVPQKIISSTISSVPVQPAVNCVKAVGNYGVQKVNNIYTQINGQNNEQVQAETEQLETDPAVPDTQSISRQ